MSRPAKTRTLLRLTASSLIITATLAGCKPAGFAEKPRSAGSTMDVTERLAGKVAAQAAQAMATGNPEAAVTLAERVVAAVPDDAGYRTLLGQAYLRAGRFVSADQAFADVIRLMPDNDKARVAQAVAKIGQGDRDGARAVLAEVTNAPADDYGLALALVGDSAKAITVLEPAARGMRGTSRTRQNLALAYALGGQWDKARAVAAQDVSPSDIDRRMENWARLASPDARDAQVATLLGTAPVVGDPGQPEMLALVKPAVQAPVALAAAEPVVPAPAPISTPRSVSVAASDVPVMTAMAQSPSTSTSVVAAPAMAEKYSAAAPIPTAPAPAVSIPAAPVAAVQVAVVPAAPVPAAVLPVAVTPVQALALVPANSRPVTRIAAAAPSPGPVAIVPPAAPAPASASVVALNIPSPAIPSEEVATTAADKVKSAVPIAVPVPDAAAPVVASVDKVAAPVVQVKRAEIAVTRVKPQASAPKASILTRVAFDAAPLRKKVEPRGEWVVQLGAYKSQKRVEAGWIHLSDNYKRLAQYAPSHSTYRVAASGVVFHRLSVTGFANRALASALCQAIRGKGGSCFVRRQANDAPIQMVSRDRDQFAGL